MKYNKIFLLLILLPFISCECPNNCNEHGECIWVKLPGERMPSFNSTDYVCECNSDWQGLGCETKRTISDDEKAEIKKEVEEEVAEEETVLIGDLGRIAITALVGYICGIIGFIVVIFVGIQKYLKYKKKKLERNGNEELHERINPNPNLNSNPNEKYSSFNDKL
jgi:hypothetical protein